MLWIFDDDAIESENLIADAQAESMGKAARCDGDDDGIGGKRVEPHFLGAIGCHSDDGDSGERVVIGENGGGDLGSAGDGTTNHRAGEFLTVAQQGQLSDGADGSGTEPIA